MKHSTNTLNLRPTLAGISASIPFSELLSMLDRSEATGIVRALAADDEHFEIRLASGVIVRVAGRDQQEAQGALTELVRAESLAFTFRATPGAPEGPERIRVEEALLAAAFAGAA